LPRPARRSSRSIHARPRRFAEAIGRQAKTDAVEAGMLARFAAHLEPPVRPVVSATLDAMKELHVARRARARRL
jgi:hypothetical protein